MIFPPQVKTNFVIHVENIRFFISVTIPETVRAESDRPRRRQACSCRTAFVMWLLPFLNEGQNRDRTL